MAIKDVIQPNLIEINSNLRLRKYDSIFDFALPWYQDMDTVRLVDGIEARAYDMDKLRRMYQYLDQHGELYFIEVIENGIFVPIGDVTFWQEDMPIVIGDKRFRNRGIGLLIVRALIQRAKTVGYHTIYVNEIYHFNKASQALFEKAGFKTYKSTAKGFSYRLDLHNT